MTKVDGCLKKFGEVVVSLESPTDNQGVRTSTFRELRDNKPHAGVDIYLEKGSNVKAASIGEVWRTRDASGYGKMVVLKHSDELFTLYAHLDKVQVREGECVSTGDVIGFSGNTGRVTGPTGNHLHFEIIKIPKGSGFKINRNDEESLGIKSTQIELRTDPTGLLSEEHRKMITVNHSEAFRKTALPGAATAGLVGAIAGGVSHGLAALSFLWEGALSLAAAAIAGATFHLVVKSSMESKAQERLKQVRAGLNLTVTPEMVASQLAEAERTGDQSPLQRTKIMSSIRAEVDAARSSVAALHDRMNSIERELDTLSRELSSVESDIRRASTEQDLQRARKQRESIEERRTQLLKESREVEERAQAAGRRVEEAGARGEAANDAMRRNEENSGGGDSASTLGRANAPSRDSAGGSSAPPTTSTTSAPAPAPAQADADAHLTVIHLSTDSGDSKGAVGRETSPDSSLKLQKP